MVMGIPAASPGPDDLEGTFFDDRIPRPCQEEAVARSLGSGRGTVVLPTGAGKSLVALLAIRRIGVGACVVVPYLLPLDGTRSWA
jgi:superfamily II DNA or RNA helicase